MRHLKPILWGALLSSTLTVSSVTAQDTGERQEPRGAGAEDLGATTDAFLMEDGEAICQNACAGCHQPQGQGAIGAATYPPMGANPRLQGGHYPVFILINGMGAMPAFGDWLTDEQIVEVVTYIQQNFGNDYSEHPTPDMVADLRKEAEENAADSDEED